MVIKSDEALAYLLSLGYDIELCKQALNQFNSVEEATEWLIDPAANQPHPVLNLNVDPPTPQTESSSTPPQPKHTQANEQDTKQTKRDTDKEEQEREKREKRRKEDEELTARRKKEFNDIATQLKKDRKMQNEAKKRALLDIRQDKEKRKEKQNQKAIHQVKQQQQQQQETAPKEASSSSTVSKGKDTAFIQFRHSDGSVVRQKYPSVTQLITLFEFVHQKETQLHSVLQLDDISLVSTIQRRTFNSQDKEMSVQEAGFLPNVSLDIRITLPQQPMESEEHQENEEENEEENEVREEEEDGENESDHQDEHMSTDDDDEEETDEDIDMEGAPGRNGSNGWANRLGGGHTLTDEPVGDTEMTNASNEEAEPIADRRSHMLSAIQQRTGASSSGSDNKVVKPHIKRKVKSLKDICATLVTGMLTQYTTTANQYLKELVNISSDVAELLIKYLCESGKLNTSTLGKVANHCYLQRVILDAYMYCTDSLVENLCKTNSSMSLTQLSLRGCELLTDNCIQYVSGLKHLEYLDMSNCKITDKGLKYIESIGHLGYLNLSNTKITDKGLKSLTTNAHFKSTIQTLLLDRCQRIQSQDTFLLILNNFTSLVQLSLASTNIKLQNQKMEKKKGAFLEILDVSNTLIEDTDLTNVICQLKSLLDLKLNGCENITTKSLSFLPRELKHLRSIRFPNREHEIDGVLARYKDLPLRTMDLSSFVNLTDEGLQYISEMKDLEYLGLNGTKITDEGLCYLKDLAKLRTLYLDFTAVTDAGLQQLIGLSKLETLSLSRTRTTNETLCLFGDFEVTGFTKSLRTLNLSQCTHVSDKGVKGLSGMLNLTNLNLDHTGVSKKCLMYLADLKHLTTVRLQGIVKEEDDEMDTD